MKKPYGTEVLCEYYEDNGERVMQYFTRAMPFSCYTTVKSERV